MPPLSSVRPERRATTQSKPALMLRLSSVRPERRAATQSKGDRRAQHVGSSNGGNEKTPQSTRVPAPTEDTQSAPSASYGVLDLPRDRPRVPRYRHVDRMRPFSARDEYVDV